MSASSGTEDVKLSIVIICWNDLKCIGDCLKSIYAETRAIEFEVILADNGSTDASVAYVRQHFPAVRIVRNGTNLGFGPGNNAGFRVACGEYVLILNPDTVIHDRALEKWVAYADRHAEAGAFGCRDLNTNGSLQGAAQPTPTVAGYFIGAFYLRWLGRFSKAFPSDTYTNWDGRTEREIGFQAGCCLLIRAQLLQALSGFDPRFLHQFEDADLCHRVWKNGKSVLYCPTAEITHIGGQNRGRYPSNVVLETQRSRVRYFYKHYGAKAAKRIRWITLLYFGIRFFGYRFISLVRPTEALRYRLEMYRIIIKWHWRLNPVRFAEAGEEPDVGCAPLGLAPKAFDEPV